MSPRTLKQYLGLVKFYHRFVPNGADLLRPLHRLCDNTKASSALEWDDTTLSAFTSSKQALASAALLSHPHPDAPLALRTDASDVGVGGVLEQRVDGKWTPLAFTSRSLSAAETRYSVFDRELLAAYHAVRHFRSAIEGRHCTLFMDHRPLAQAFHRPGVPWSLRQQRHLSALAEVVADMLYHPGALNIVADSLSRNPSAALSTMMLGVDYQELAAQQCLSSDVRAYRIAVTGLQLKDVSLCPDEPALLCNVSRGQPHPVVPPGLR